MTGIVESVGNIGLEKRPDSRTVFTAGGYVTAPRDVRALGLETIRTGRMNASTRLQLKFPADLGVVDSPGISPFLEGYLQPDVDCIQGVVFLGHNTRDRRPDISAEWDTVRDVLSRPPRLTPHERMQQLQQNGHTLTACLGDQDIDTLTRIWEPFGWTKEGVKTFVESYNRGEAGWFAGVRDSQGQLCAAAKAESLILGDIEMIESTEWGTLPEYRGHGLATDAAIALNSMILMTPQRSEKRIIFAEANMTPEIPGYRVAHNAGFASLADLTSPIPNHVLQQHVSVDGKLRNFALMQLNQKAIDAHYHQDMMTLTQSLIH